jgi:hypothetical protein
MFALSVAALCGQASPQAPPLRMLPVRVNNVLGVRVSGGHIVIGEGSKRGGL